jgi:hypothetical protein
MRGTLGLRNQSVIIASRCTLLRASGSAAKCGAGNFRAIRRPSTVSIAS